MNARASWLIAVLVGAFFLWHGEWAARLMSTQRECEAQGFPASSVTMSLKRYCLSYGDSGYIYTPFANRATRPGEVDG